MKNNKKKYLHKQRNEAQRKDTIDRAITQVINLYPEKQQEVLLADYRETSKDRTLLKFEKYYKETLFFDFFAMLYAAVFVEQLKSLRKMKNKQAKDLDLMLGYSIGYPMASFKSTLYKPTKRNVKTTFEVYKRMGALNDYKPIDEKDYKLIDVNEILERAFVLHGYESPVYLKEQSIKTENNKEMIETQEEMETMNDTYELIINNEVVLFDENTTALNLLEKIKKHTSIEIEVFETVKERLI